MCLVLGSPVPLCIGHQCRPSGLNWHLKLETQKKGRTALIGDGVRVTPCLHLANAAPDQPHYFVDTAELTLKDRVRLKGGRAATVERLQAALKKKKVEAINKGCVKKISTSTSKYLPLKKARTEKVDANAAAAIVKMPVSTAIRVMDITTTTPQYRDTADNTAKRELLEAANAAREAKFKDRAMQRLYSNPKASDKEILKMFEQARRRNRAKRRMSSFPRASHTRVLVHRSIWWSKVGHTRG